jgi:hypothetical protein
MHHDMEGGVALVPNMIQCVDVTLIHIEEDVCGKLHRLMEPSAPLVEGRIQLCDLSAPL